MLNKKNVLFFFSSTLVGGAEVNILKISRELTSLGYKVCWCFLKDNGPLLKEVNFDLNYLETGFFYKSPITFYKSYRGFIKRNKIDIVFNFGLRVEIISRLISKKLGVKVIISNIRSTDDWRKWYHTALDRLTQSNVDCWISNSIAGKNIFHKREGIPRDKIKVIYNFFEVPDGIKEQTMNSSKGINIGVLANLTKEKGYFDLIPLAKKLEKENIDYTFFYAGYDKLNGKFQKLVEENNLIDRFKYLGYISNKSIFFNKVDMLLLPSYLEGMPTVVLEAMAFKKHIVVTNVGGIPEIILNGINGYVCEPGDIKGFATSIKNIITQDHSSFIMAGENRLKKFSKEKIMNEWTSVISDIN